MPRNASRHFSLFAAFHLAKVASKEDIIERRTERAPPRDCWNFQSFDLFVGADEKASLVTALLTLELPHSFGIMDFYLSYRWKYFFFMACYVAEYETYHILLSTIYFLYCSRATQCSRSCKTFRTWTVHAESQIITVLCTYIQSRHLCLSLLRQLSQLAKLPAELGQTS